MVTTLCSDSALSWPSTRRSRRQAGRHRQRIDRGSWEAPKTRIMVADRSLPSSPRNVIMSCLFVVACFSTSCSSFTVRQQRTQKPVVFQTQTQSSERLLNRRYYTTSTLQTPTTLFSEAIINGSAEENKKRVPVTIRYSPSTGLKPYYLTVAKRVKDQYPDVLIERVEISGEDGGGGETIDGESSGAGTFEVIVDGKIVVRNNQRAGNDNGGSIFVSMTEMDLAIARARRRRRPSTAYGENGIAMAEKQRGNEDEYGKSRLEVLKQKAQELQRNQNASGIKNANASSD